ncbi:regulator of Vps4 activity in the MVB pathway-domain-containing protein [Chaetomium sp. MPI-SDFR-AT-0129]|nr:regulator of Vps4 activity in the MVB pathway-domain-containing protein [Chaetomium sp. MPI-SDFR-AT-0129]
MPPPSTFVPKLKVQLKLAIARLRMVQKRDEALAKTQRRAMATLLEQGKIDSARIRVENIIRSDVTTELHEILELYCELLLARAGLLDASSAAAGGPGAGAGAVGCDPGLEEAVKSIIYAAPRTEIKELTTVRTLLAERFGKEFVLQAMENEGGGVSERVVKKLSVTPPREELVQGYLEEIAKAYGVDWPPGRREKEKLGEAPEFVDGDDGEGGGQRAKQQLEAPLSGEAEGDGEDDARAQLSKATPPKDFGPASPLHVNPPSATTDNIHPKVTLNKVELTPTKKPVSAPVNRKPAEKKPSISDGIPDVDELAKRFAALKR